MTDIFDNYDDKDDVVFKSNPKLKKEGVFMNLTKEQVREYIKCKNDPVYFIEKYVKFITLDGGVTNVSLYDWQRTMIKSFHNERFNVVKIPRQSGKTSTTAGYVLHYVLFNETKFVAILAHKEKAAKEILVRVKLAYENIPMWMQQGVVEWNQKSIALENGSRILIESTSATALRSYTINLMVLDEFGIVAPHIQDEFFTSVWPTVAAGTKSKVIITSTPKGLNLFYRIWQDALMEKTDPAKWNGFKAFEIHWSDVPGRDEVWAAKQRQTLKDKFDQEFGCEFLGSNSTLIDGKFLRTMAPSVPLETFLEGSLSIYARPIAGHAYALVADPAEGKDQDFSTFTVFDITQAPYTIAAVYRNNTVDSMMYAYAIQQAALHWHNAYVMVENNAHGALVLHHILYDMEYDNIFYSMSSPHNELTVAQESGAKIPGIRTTKKVKHQGCLRLKTLVEQQQIIINDFNMIQELYVFVRNNNNSFSAEENYHDDLCSNLWLFAWLTAQPFFRDISDLQLRSRLYHDREVMMSAMIPAQPKVVSENYKPAPALEKDSDGFVWIPAEISYEDALEMLQSKASRSREERLYNDNFFDSNGRGDSEELEEKLRGRDRPYPWNTN